LTDVRIFFVSPPKNGSLFPFFWENIGSLLAFASVLRFLAPRLWRPPVFFVTQSPQRSPPCPPSNTLYPRMKFRCARNSFPSSTVSQVHQRFYSHGRGASRVSSFTSQACPALTPLPTSFPNTLSLRLPRPRPFRVGLLLFR